MIEVRNLFTEQEVNLIKKESETYNWLLNGRSDDRLKDVLPSFWFKGIVDNNFNSCNLIGSLFKKKLENYLNKNIDIERLYFNGQAHGQCGFWHTDYDPSDVTRLTLVYFINDWKPEYGGHLLIRKDNQVYSFLPQYNYGVLFEGTLFHIGLEPTMHCKTQRESIACKFILR